MASDKHEEPSHHRKHRRSSPSSSISDDEAAAVEKSSSKRHKHRHHHRHHHRRHRDKKRNEESNNHGGEDYAAARPPPSNLPVGGDDEVEEGEILEEDGEFRERDLQMDGDTRPVDEDVGDKNQANPSSEPQDRLLEKLGKKDGINGELAHESQRDDKRPQREFGSPSKRSGKRNYNSSDAVELDGNRNSYNRSSYSSESSGEKYTSVIHSPSHGRYFKDIRARSRSMSRDLDNRGRSRSRSVMEEDAALRRRHRRERDSSRDHRHNSVHLERDEEKYYHHGRYEEEVRHRSREVLNRERSREREIDRERKREKECEGSRIREINTDRRRERERDRRDIEEDRERRREKERDNSRDIDRRREKERDRIRERDRESEWERYRDGDSERERFRDRDGARHQSREREREKERGREKEKERRDGRNRDSCLEIENNREKQSRHSRYENENSLERIRTDSLKSKTSKGDDHLRGNEEKLQRDADEQDANEEGIVWELPEQEEEELNRIKEESRKRRQAILEKYKNQQSLQQDESSTEGNKKDSVRAGNLGRSSDAVLNATGQNDAGKTDAEKNDAVDAVIFENVAAADNVRGEDATVHGGSKNDSMNSYAEALLAVGKSPSQDAGPGSERTCGPAGLGEGTPKSERSADMFCDDIFGDSPAGARKTGKVDGLPIVRSGLHDNWDDAEGYYSYQFGELLDGRYEVAATHGKGVFSTVVRAKDLKAGPDEPDEVAIKIIRNNETMHKAGQTEVQILKKLAGADPENRRHCVRFLSSFKYRNHLCLVFESLHLNLREVLKKFGRNIGLKLTAVRAYAKQLFIALKHLKNCGVLHCDIKPDNMLVNEAKNVLKLCDFGNAMFAGKNEVTPYLVSRFYRAPEIILGLPYDHPLDMWSVGCCLYELYSGKVLFPGPTNNDMLRLHMELKGPFPKKMLRKGAFTDQHFDQDLSFHAAEEDPVTGKAIKRMILNIKPKDIGSIIKGYPGEDPKMLTNFKDLLDKIFVLDPERRLTVSQALAHPFITGK